MSKTGTLLKQYIQFVKSGQGFEKVMEKVKVVSVGDGHCKAEFVVQPEQSNAFGYLHGGFSATLVDIISGIALLSHKCEGGGVSVNMSLAFLKSAKIGEEVEVEAKTIKAGKSFGFLETQIKNKTTGDVLVTASHTKYIGQNVSNSFI